MTTPSDGPEHALPPTDTRSVEVAGTASEARYQTLFDRAPIGILFADAESYYLDANACMCEMLGYTRDELIGMHATDIVAPAETPHIGDALREIHGDVDHRREWRFRRKDGTHFLADVTATKFADGTLLGMVRDITEIREHEIEIDRITRLYDALSQVNQAIVWSLDRGELFRRVCRVLVERGGLRMAWIGWHDPETRQLVPAAAFGDEYGYLEKATLYADDRPEVGGLLGRIIRAGQTYVSNDMLNDPAALPRRALHERCGFHAAAVFPIRLQGVLCATLCVYADRPGYFHDREIALLEEAAADVSFALDNFVRDEARRETEQMLRDEKLFSDTMIESMPGLVYFYDTEGNFLRWNKNFETVSGYTAEEIARMHPTDFFAGDDKPLLEERIAEVFTHGDSSVEASFVARDGSTTPYFFTGRRIDFEGQVRLVGVGIDISERKHAEARLRESEAHLIEAQRIAKMGSWESNLATGRLTWSSQVYRIFGLQRKDFTGTREAFLQYVHPEDRDRLEAAQRAAIAGQSPLDIIHRIVRPDGGERIVHELADLRRDASGEPLCLAGTVHDITDRVRAETERERRHRAEAADRIKSAFLATMSHEFRTPLNSIIGFTGIVLQELAGPLNPEQRKQLDMVRGSARHLLALVNDVLDISKIEAGQFDVAREPFDIPASIDKVCALFAPQLEAKGLALRAEIAPGLGGAVGDARRFEQVLFNLLGNAIKFTDRGAVALAAERIADYAPGGGGPGIAAVRITVTDTGIGIKAEDIPDLFQPFRQIDSGLARIHEGSGLGLAICHRLTALMGGEIGVESDWGKGSTFRVTLPLEGPEEP